MGVSCTAQPVSCSRDGRLLRAGLSPSHTSSSRTLSVFTHSEHKPFISIRFAKQLHSLGCSFMLLMALSGVHSLHNCDVPVYLSFVTVLWVLNLRGHHLLSVLKVSSVVGSGAHGMRPGPPRSVC